MTKLLFNVLTRITMANISIFWPKSLWPILTARAHLQSKEFPEVVHFLTKIPTNVLTGITKANISIVWPKSLGAILTARADTNSPKWSIFLTKLLSNVLTTMPEIAKICQNLQFHIWSWFNSLTWSISQLESLGSQLMRLFLV